MWPFSALVVIGVGDQRNITCSIWSFGTVDYASSLEKFPLSLWYNTIIFFPYNWPFFAIFLCLPFICPYKAVLPTVQLIFIFYTVSLGCPVHRWSESPVRYGIVENQWDLHSNQGSAINKPCNPVPFPTLPTSATFYWESPVY